MTKASSVNGGKLSNAFAHLNRGYAWALEKMKDVSDQGQVPEEELALGVGAVEHEVDLKQLSSDLSFIFIDKSPSGFGHPSYGPTFT